MKRCILFGNCHCNGVKKFLEYSNFFEQYEVQKFANWELIKDSKNMSIPVHLIKNADLVIYQPLSDVYNCYSTNKENPDSFFQLLKDECKTVSFPRIHNNAFFPIFHKNNKKHIFYGTITNNAKSVNELIFLYNNDLIDYDFKARMDYNYCVSKEKEADCDIKIADFIFDNVQNHKLFLTQDHPTSLVFNKLTSQICEQLDLEYDYERALTAPENMTNLEDSVYARADKQYPISRYAIRHFNFKYIKEESEDANKFYGNNTVDYFVKTALNRK
uniref:Polysaccharide biosynthesis enzyme WcbI domain-containing protein n=1 Tax=viral metagenome TaxID=1070528 RepID=A0A6C0B748_9ZZZZ